MFTSKITFFNLSNGKDTKTVWCTSHSNVHQIKTEFFFVVNHVFSVIFCCCLRMTIFISGSCWIDGTAGNNQAVYNSTCRVSNKVSHSFWDWLYFCSISFNSSTGSSKIYYFCHCFISIKLSSAFLRNLRGPNRSGGDLHLNPIYLGDICNSLLIHLTIF